MHFPGSGDAGPYCRFDGRDGSLIISTEGEAPDKQVPSIGKVLAFDVRNAKQGWLKVSTAGADWVPLPAVDAWGTPPSDDHSAGVDVPVVSDDADFGDQRVRSCRGASKAFIRMFQAILDAVGQDVPDNALPTIRITACDRIAVGAGHSTDIKFDLAPRDKWLARPDPAPTPMPTTAAPPDPAGSNGQPPASGAANW